MTSVVDLVSVMRKKYGEETIRRGADRDVVDRLPTGVFELDYALGGGIPRARFIEIFGPESSGKTNLVLKLIAMNQALNPSQRNIFIDLENSFDPSWAERMGVDTEELLVVSPDSAEQSVDMVEGILGAEDCGVIAIDSLAGMMTRYEIEKSAEQDQPGGASRIIGKMCRKTTRIIADAQKQGREPVFLCVNQTRSKIGVMFGSPETTTGGNAPKFYASVRIRCYGKNVSDSKVADIPVAKEMTAHIVKHKVDICAEMAKFQMIMVPHKGLSYGDTDCWNTVMALLEEHEELGKAENGKGYIMLGEHYPRLKDCKARFMEDESFRRKLQAALIAKGREELIPAQNVKPGVTINVE